MPLPKHRQLTELRKFKRDPELYESLRKLLSGQNDLITALGRGEALVQGAFTFVGMGSGARVSAHAGTYKRGRFTFIVGTGPSANAKVILTWPANLWAEDPMSTVVRNGGTGTLGYSYEDDVNKLEITLAGTPTAGHVYTFNFAVRE